MTQKSNLSQYSLFLDKKLVSEFDKAIFPYKRSNVVHQLISEFLDNKKMASPSTSRTTPKMTVKKEVMLS